MEIQINKNVLEPIYNALKPETKAPPTERSRSQIMIKDSMVIIEIVANDLTSTRAAVNSYLRWLAGILNCLEVTIKWGVKKKK